MTFGEASERLVQLAQEQGGVLTAARVEQDQELSADRDLVAAAARALDGSTNMFGTPRAAGVGGWFPFQELRFTGQPCSDRRRESDASAGFCGWLHPLVCPFIVRWVMLPVGSRRSGGLVCVPAASASRALVVARHRLPRARH